MWIALKSFAVEKLAMAIEANAGEPLRDLGQALAEAKTALEVTAV